MKNMIEYMWLSKNRAKTVGALIQHEDGASNFIAVGMQPIKDGSGEETFRGWFDILVWFSEYPIVITFEFK